MRRTKRLLTCGMIGVCLLLLPAARAQARTDFSFGLTLGVPLDPYPAYPYPYAYPYAYPYGFPYVAPYPPPGYYPPGSAYPRCVRVWVPGYYDAYGNWVFGYYRYECW